MHTREVGAGFAPVARYLQRRFARILKHPASLFFAWKVGQLMVESRYHCSWLIISVIRLQFWVLSSSFALCIHSYERARGMLMLGVQLWRVSTVPMFAACWHQNGRSEPNDCTVDELCSSCNRFEKWTISKSQCNAKARTQQRCAVSRRCCHKVSAVDGIFIHQRRVQMGQGCHSAHQSSVSCSQPGRMVQGVVSDVSHCPVLHLFRLGYPLL